MLDRAFKEVYHPFLPREATINNRFVYVGHTLLNGTFPVNASILEMMKFT